MSDYKYISDLVHSMRETRRESSALLWFAVGAVVSGAAFRRKPARSRQGEASGVWVSSTTIAACPLPPTPPLPTGVRLLPSTSLGQSDS